MSKAEETVAKSTPSLIGRSDPSRSASTSPSASVLDAPPRAGLRSHRSGLRHHVGVADRLRAGLWPQTVAIALPGVAAAIVAGRAAASNEVTPSAVP
jgi:hypothetical protein